MFQLIVYGVGNIVGAGIYVLVGDAAGLAGGLVWLAFLVGAVAALFTGLSYAELSSMYPKAASEYVYVGRAYGNRLLSFLTEWTMLLTEVVAAAAVAFGFAGYLASITNAPVLPVAAALLVFLTIFTITGIKQSLRLNTILSFVAIAGLVAVVIVGSTKFGSTSYVYSPNGFSGVLGAAALVFFAYIGFDNITNLAEETKRPEVTVPRGLLLALAISSALYVLVGIASVSLAPWQDLSSSQAPLALAVSTVLGPAAFRVMAVAAMLTTMNTVLVLLIVSSRIVYGMAREGALPSALGKVSEKRRSPYVASALTLVLALGFLSIGSVEGIAKVTSFGSLLTFALINSVMLHLRRAVPHAKRRFRAPFSIGWISVTAALGLMSCLFLLAQLDVLSISVGLLLPGSGLAFYIILNRGRARATDLTLHQEHER